MDSNYLRNHGGASGGLGNGPRRGGGGSGGPRRGGGGSGQPQRSILPISQMAARIRAAGGRAVRAVGRTLRDGTDPAQIRSRAGGPLGVAARGLVRSSAIGASVLTARAIANARQGLINRGGGGSSRPARARRTSVARITAAAQRAPNR